MEGFENQWYSEDEQQAVTRPWTAEIATVTDGGMKPKYNLPTRGLQDERQQALDKTIQAAADASHLARSPMTKKNRELWAAQVDASFSAPVRPVAAIESSMPTQQAKEPFLQVRQSPAPPARGAHKLIVRRCAVQGYKASQHPMFGEPSL